MPFEITEENKIYINAGLLIAAVIIIIYCLIPNLINCAVLAAQLEDCKAEIRELRTIILQHK